jgi:WD40 repeat protein
MRLANTTMQYQVSATRAKSVRFTSFICCCTSPYFVIDAIITGSWDRTVRFWDPRASNAQQSSQQLPERVYFMDTVGNRLVIALASRLFHIFDVRKMDTPEQTRESSLKFLTRALACMSDGQGTSTPTFPFSSSIQQHSFTFRIRHGVRRGPHRSRIL